MYYKSLYHIVETIASRKFNTEIDLLKAVVQELVQNEKIVFVGGRIWQLNLEKRGYEIKYQIGKIDNISKNFLLKVEEYPHFDKFVKERTVLGHEINIHLRKKGIFKYSASGVGDKKKINNQPYYEYLIAFSVPNINEELKNSLSIIAATLTAKLKQQRSSSLEQTLKADIDKARQLQKSILPEHDYFFPPYELYGLTVPAENLGGDFFDYLTVGDDEDRLGIILGDAASKGIGAAAEAMYISGAIRMASTFQIKIAPFMKRINNLVNMIFSDDKFSSLFYGELSTDKSGLFLYANAGHNPPIFLKKKSNEIKELQPTGPVLGPAPKAHYSVENINFSVGDVLVIYSDGIVEAQDKNANEYGEARLKTLLQKIKHCSSRDIALKIMESVIKFSANGVYQDDRSLIVIKKVE